MSPNSADFGANRNRTIRGLIGFTRFTVPAPLLTAVTIVKFIFWPIGAIAIQERLQFKKKIQTFVKYTQFEMTFLKGLKIDTNNIQIG